jgi:hypothetical protein
MIFFPAHPRYLVAQLMGAVLATAWASGASACGNPAGEARIVEVTERLEFRLSDGRLLRLAGLEAPAPELALDRVAAEWADRPLQLSLLASRPDRWGRWLADLAAPNGDSLSDDLIRAGSLRIRPEQETLNCEEPRLAAEQDARRRKIGLWNEPHAILAANDLTALADAESRLAVVEGEVLRVGEGRSRVYLDFGGREGFTVVVPRKSETVLQRRGIDLRSLAGHFVLVRGYLENRFAPRIELADPLMIERTEGVGGSGSGG